MLLQGIKLYPLTHTNSYLPPLLPPPSSVLSLRFVQSELHVFAAEMLEDIRSISVLDKFEDLFDCAALEESGTNDLADMLGRICVTAKLD